MGEVKEYFQLTNFSDLCLAKGGHLPKDKIRSLQLEMIVNTGATMVVLSEDIARKLGLEKENEVYMRLADNSLRKCFKAKGLLVQFDGRESLTDCLIGEKGIESLLGQIPLEEMDLVVDCNNKRIIPNPDSPDKPVLKVYRL